MSIKAQADPRPVGRAKLLRIVVRQKQAYGSIAPYAIASSRPTFEQSKWMAALGHAHEGHGLRDERREPQSVPSGYGGYDDAA